MANGPKLLSGRVPVVPLDQLSADRYQYLSLGQAEPNLGNGVANSVLVIQSNGNRVWANSLTLTTAAFSGNVTAANFVGNISGNITAPGSNTQILFNDAGIVSGNTALTFDKATSTLAVSGDALVTGNLSVNGNLVYINVENLTIEDPLISLGRGANNAPLTMNDGKDRGEQLYYYTSSEKSAFIGYDNSAANLLLATDVSIVNEIVTVNNFGNVTLGNLSAQFVTASANINAANIIVSSNVLATGNISGSYLLGNGAFLTGIDTTLISNGTSNLRVTTAGGNLAANVGGTANVLVISSGGMDITGTFSATSNISGGNVTTAGQVSATGNVSGNNLSAVNIVSGNTGSFTGNVSANRFIGNIDAGGANTQIQFNDNDVLAGSMAFSFDKSSNLVTALGNITAGNLSTSGQVTATSNVNAPRLRSTNTNLAAPSPGNYNSERVTLYDFNNNVKTNYAIGVESSAIWMGVDSNLEAQGFKWYGNTTEVARLSGVGNLTLAGNLIATANVVGGNITTAGQAVVTGNVTGGNLTTVGTANIGTLAVTGSGNVVGNVNAGNFISAGRFGWSGTGSNSRITNDGSISLVPDTSYDGTAGILIGGSGYVLGPNGSRNLTLNYNSENGVAGAYRLGVVGNQVQAITNFGSNTVGTIGNSTTYFGNAYVSNIWTGIVQAANITSSGNIAGNFVAPGANREMLFNDNGLISSNALITFDRAGPTLSLNTATATIITGFVSSLGGSDLALTPATSNLVIWASANPRFSNTYTLGTSTFQWRNVWAGNGNIATLGVTTLSVTGNISAGNVTTTGIGNIGTLAVTGTATITGNVTGGNLATAGGLNATGNITGGNVVSNAAVTAVGNVTGGNLITSGLINATGNVSGGNLTTAGQVVATGNITSGNLITSGLINATGNVNGGNISTTGVINATGNITGGNVVSNAAVTAVGNVSGGNISTVGIIQATGNISSNANVIGANLATAGNVYGNHLIAAANVEVLGNKITSGTTTGIEFEAGNVSLISGNLIVDGNYIYSQNGDTAIALVNNGEIGSVGIYNNLQVGKDGQGNLEVAGYANVTNDLTVGGNTTVIGNITGGNLNTGNQVVATGNITGGNIITSGNVTSTGNINSTGNVVAANVVSANIGSAGDITVSTLSNGNINLNPNGAGNVVLASDTYINNVRYPAQDKDAASKIYVDTLATTSISYHEAVFAATVANLATATGGTITYAQPNGAGNGVGATITTTGSFNLIDTANVQTANTRILVKDEGNAVLNGIYVWSNATVITRSADADTYGVASSNRIAINDYFFVSSGNVNKGSAYIVDSPAGVITFGTSNIQFAQFSSTQVYTAGNGIDVSGTVISARVDNNTTAFNNTGEIIVKAGANLTTPDIGAATGVSLTTTGNITANNISANSFLAATTINATGNITSGNIISNGAAVITGNASAGNLAISNFANVSGNLHAFGNAHFGQDLSFSAAYANLQYAGSANNYVQLVAQNKDNGSAASTDFVATADNGTDADTYIDMGINSSGYSQAEFSLQKPNDGYLYVAGNTTTGGGNLVLSTLENNDIIFSTGGANTGDEQGRFQYGNGFKVTGNVYATGNIHAPWFIGNIFGNISGNLTVVGPNRGVVFNDDGVANSGAAFTFDKLSNLVSITGNLSLSGNVTANGNVSGNYILGNGAFLSGVITSVANINNGTSNVRIETSGGNIMANVGGTANVLTLASTGAYVDGLINATGNITGANIFTAGIVSATGNITGGNLITSGEILATGNVTGNYFYGNGYFLNGVALDVARIYNGSSNVRIDTSGGNILANVGGVANVFAITTVGANVSGNLGVTGNVSANYYLGNGAFLTGVITSVANINNGTSNVRIDTSGGNIYANVGGSANVVEISSNALTVNGNIESVNGYFVGNGVFLTGVVASSSNSTGVTNINYGLSNVRIDTPGGNISANVGSSANVLVLTTNGANITGNLAVTGNVSASYFIGNGSQLTGLVLGSSSNIANGTSNVNIPTANGNVNTTVGGTANVFVVTAGGANVLGNLAVTDTVSAALFIGNANASSLTSGTVPGGRLTGTYAIDISGHANTANTVTDASQPNITSVGTLNSLTVTGNITATTGNISGGNLLTTGIVQATANITGGNLVTAGQVVATGNVIGNYFIGNGAFLTGIDTTLISNGTSNVKIVSANGNATVNIDGTGNVAVFANTGVYVTGLANVTGNVNAGNINTTQVVATANVSGNNIVASNLVSATGNVSGGNLTTPGAVVATGNVTGGNVASLGTIDATGNVTGGNLVSNSAVVATGNVSGLNLIASAGISASTTISATGNITGGNLVSNAAVVATGNVSGANITTTGQVDATGNVTGGNVTTAGTANVGTLAVTGNATAVGNVSGGNIITAGIVSATGNIIGGNFETTGNAVIGGNLTVSGNTTYINVESFTVEDPIISMGRGANDAPLTVDDGKDRGTQLWYYSSQEKQAFFGYDNSAAKLIAATNVTITGEVVSVTDWGNLQIGTLEANSTNITGNINTSGIVASGNITANYYFGNAVNMTGIATATSVYSTINLTGNVTGNSAGNVTLRAANSLGNLNLQSGNGITMSGNATNGNLIIAVIGSTNDGTFWGAGGDAGLVTDPTTSTLDNGLITDAVTSAYDLGVFEYGVAAGGTLTVSPSAPPNPAAGDQWIDLTDGTLYLYFDDGSGSQWAQMASVYSINEPFVPSALLADLIPNANVTYSLGNTTNYWNSLYANTITAGGDITTTGNVSGGNLITTGLISATGNVSGGNLITTGLISAIGNVTGNYILGNGALLTGVITSVANINSGTSNVTVVSSGGNVTVGVANTANVAIFADSGLTISNVKITGNIDGAGMLNPFLLAGM